jgi:hydroxypyruvate isomerase
MPQFAANLSFLYGEHDFLDRFGAAAADGFRAVEYLFPYDHETSVLSEHLHRHGLRQVLFNAPPGDWQGGERGLACLSGREAEFQRGLLERALPYATALRCPRIHVMAGVVPASADRARHWETYIKNLSWAAQQAAPHGVEILIEPINTQDMPGYFLYRQADAHRMVMECGAANLKVQMDLYHCQITEGDAMACVRDYLPSGRVSHIQIAGVPGRHEPNVGMLNTVALFKLIDDLGYIGYVGCEYRPLAGTSAGLGWMRG